MTYRFERIKLLAIIRLRKWKDEAKVREAESVLFPNDPFIREMNRAFAGFNRWIPDLVEPKPIKFVKVYSGPGYPIDPQRKLDRESGQFCSLLHE